MMPDTLPLTPEVSARDLAAYLTENGVKIMGEPTEPTDTKDGEIGLTDKFHVQVGRGYALLNEWGGDEPHPFITFGKWRTDGQDILADIRAKVRSPLVLRLS